MKVVFLFNVENADLFAFFPEDSGYNGNYGCYSNVGQHSTCSVAYAHESRQAQPHEYEALLNELQKIYDNTLQVERKEMYFADRTVLRNGYAIKYKWIADEHVIEKRGVRHYATDFLCDAIVWADSHQYFKDLPSGFNPVL